MTRTLRASPASTSIAREVPGVVETPAGFRSGDAEPARADEGEQDVARANAFLDALHEVLARGNQQVHEDLVLAEALNEVVVEAARVRRAVLPPVADEYAGRKRLPREGREDT